MRKPIIAANWKMNKTVSQTKEFMSEFIKKDFPDNIEVLVCPPYLGLQDAIADARGSKIMIGAQNMHYEDAGAYTGEVSPIMLGDLGVDYVIVGHSERRQYFAETNESVNKKVRAALKYNLKPIVCVGENLAEYEAGQTQAVISRQIEEGLAWLSADQVASLVIAYEPVWAIGTGKSSSPAEANQVIKEIRNQIKAIYDTETDQRVRIQYGGSVNPSNIQEYMGQSDIDGVLVGGASLEVDSFYNLVVFV